MAPVTANCPYCDTEREASIPNGTELKRIEQSWENGLRGPSNLVEVGCDCGQHFGLLYR